MKISVIIPLYNKVKYIRETIESVLCQSYKDFEILVVDDGSTDGGDKIVEEIADPRIKLIRQGNAGVSAARNTGIKNAKGDWIAFLDADDFWLKDNLKSHVELHNKHPQLLWSSGLYQQVYPDEKKEQKQLGDDFLSEIQDDIVPDILKFIDRGYIHTITLFIKKQIFNEIGFFDTTFKTGEDLDMWIRFAIKYPQLGYINRPISEYRVEVSHGLVKSIPCNLEQSSAIAFSDKYLEEAKKLPLDRRTGLINLCRNKVKNQIITLVIAGNFINLIKNKRLICQKLGCLNCVKYLIFSLSYLIKLKIKS